MKKNCLFLILCCLAPLAPILESAEPVELRLGVTFDPGKDLGQNFGSLFEVRDAKGQVVAGAGFMEVYNTRFRSNRHTVQFFLRPDQDTERFTVKRLPHPNLGTGVYLFDNNQRLFAWTSEKNNSVRRWNDTDQQWQTRLGNAPAPMIRSGDGIMQVGSGTLVFSNGQATFEGKQILSAPKQGSYFNFYYAQGHLFFYHRFRAEQGSFTKIYASPWTPDQEGPVNLEQAIILETPYEQETPFSYGQFQKEILTVSNMGGIYIFNGTHWRTLLAPDNTVSYQVYSILNYHDRLLLAQYPSGHLFEYQGQQVKHLEGWPPRLPGVSSSAREAQTTVIYRGDLLVGVWPWAELWRYHRDEKQWHSLGRMFTHPKITNKTTHPYEAAANQLKLVTNHWGQRVTGMIPLQDSLMLSTSSKGTGAWRSHYQFLDEPQRREYGAVVKLNMPGNLATQIKWQNAPMQLEFLLQNNRMIIRQDGQTLATTAAPGRQLTRGKGWSVHWGTGVFGPVNARLSRTVSEGLGR
ncbi:MAG: hypothetical protein VB877_13300 [Pirellulaceae bacterium]